MQRGDFPPPHLSVCFRKNALDLTAPASDALLINRKNAWVQLAGHPGAFAPAGPNTIWKKRMSRENYETGAYQAFMNDSIKEVVPKFHREVEYNGDFFIEMEDLLQHFHDPSIMDIKVGTRTFLESEVKNPVLRKDLYEKMINIDQDEPTPEEHEARAITKLRYMQFREQRSSTATMGFRIDAIRMHGQSPTRDLKRTKTKEQVTQQIAHFIHSSRLVRDKLLARMKVIRQRFEASRFFKSHEVIGSSLLIMYDKQGNAGVWLIDFAKTLPVTGRTLNHRSPWVVGNHEDGYLVGIDSMIEILTDMQLDSPTNGSTIDIHNVLIEDKAVSDSNSTEHSTTAETTQALLGRCGGSSSETAVTTKTAESPSQDSDKTCGAGGELNKKCVPIAKQDATQSSGKCVDVVSTTS